MKLRVAFQSALVAGSLLAIVGGGAIGVCTMIDPEMAILHRLQAGYQHIIFGFVFLTLFAGAPSLSDTLSRVGRPAPEPERVKAPEPVAVPVAVLPPAPPKADPS